MNKRIWSIFALGFAAAAGLLAVRGAAVVYASTLVLWILRWFGMLGGPVPV